MHSFRQGRRFYVSRQYAFDHIKLAAELGIEPEERDILLTGGDHDYRCRCDVCRKWWKIMGPDPENGKCGSFTMEELGLDPADYPEFLFNVREGK